MASSDSVYSSILLIIIYGLYLNLPTTQATTEPTTVVVTATATVSTDSTATATDSTQTTDHSIGLTEVTTAAAVPTEPSGSPTEPSGSTTEPTAVATATATDSTDSTDSTATATDSTQTTDHSTGLTEVTTAAAVPTTNLPITTAPSDPCYPNPCNGANCTANETATGGFTCDCPEGIGGDTCNVDVDECVENPCGNFANTYCLNGNRTVNQPRFQCLCFQGTTRRFRRTIEEQFSCEPYRFAYRGAFDLELDYSDDLNDALSERFVYVSYRGQIAIEGIVFGAQNITVEATTTATTAAATTAAVTTAAATPAAVTTTSAAAMTTATMAAATTAAATMAAETTSAATMAVETTAAATMAAETTAEAATTAAVTTAAVTTASAPAAATTVTTFVAADDSAADSAPVPLMSPAIVEDEERRFLVTVNPGNADDYPADYVGNSLAFSESATTGFVTVDYILYYVKKQDVTKIRESIEENTKNCNQDSCEACQKPSQDVCVKFNKKKFVIEDSRLHPCNDSNARACDTVSTTCDITVDPEDIPCKCKDGFKPVDPNDPDKYRCQDVNECETKCKKESERCINKPGSYECVCNEGYYGKSPKCIKFCGENCLNGGTCDGPKMTCSCAKGFDGKFCQVSPKPEPTTDLKPVAIGLGVTAGILLILLIAILVLTYGKNRSPTTIRDSVRRGQYGAVGFHGSTDSVSGVYIGDSDKGKSGGGGGGQSGDIGPTQRKKETAEVRQASEDDHEYIQMEDPPTERSSDREKLTQVPVAESRGQAYAYDNPAGPKKEDANNVYDDLDDDELEASYL